VLIKQGYTTALQGLGFQVEPPDTTVIEGTTVVRSLAPDGLELVVVVIIPPAALLPGGAFEDAADLAPPEQGFVVVLAFLLVDHWLLPAT